MKNASKQDNTTNEQIAQSLAEALVESGTLSRVENELWDFGIRMPFPNKSQSDFEEELVSAVSLPKVSCIPRKAVSGQDFFADQIVT